MSEIVSSLVSGSNKATRAELSEAPCVAPAQTPTHSLLKDAVITRSDDSRPLSVNNIERPSSDVFSFPNFFGSHDTTISSPHVPAATIERDKDGRVCSFLLAQQWETGERASVYQDESHHLPQSRASISYLCRTHVPNVAEPVPVPDLAKSVGLVTSRADRILARETANYNCHYYTATCVLGHEPKSKLGPTFDVFKDMFGFSSRFLSDDRFQRIQACGARDFQKGRMSMKEGDIILVKDPINAAASQLTHSAVVVRAKTDGNILIRQKFDAKHSVVDLSIDQFQRAYLYDDCEQIEIWRK